MFKKSLQCIAEHTVNPLCVRQWKLPFYGFSLTIFFCPCLPDTDPSTFLKSSIVFFFTCKLNHTSKTTLLKYKIDHAAFSGMLIKLKKRKINFKLKIKICQHFSARKSNLKKLFYFPSKHIVLISDFYLTVRKSCPSCDESKKIQLLTNLASDLMKDG